MPTIASRPGPQGGPADHVARPGQQADGRGRCREAEQARHGEPAVGRAGLGEDAAQGAVPAGRRSRRDRQGERGRRRVTTVSKRGRSTGSCAATTTVRPSSHGSIAGARRATVGGSSEAVGSSSRRMGAGQSRARARATRCRSPELSVRPSWPSGRLEPGGQVAQQLGQADGGEHVEQVVVGGVGRPEPQVLRHRRVEEVRPLREPREVAAPLGGGQRGGGTAVERQRPRAGLDEAQQGGQHGRLARSRGAGQRHPRARARRGGRRT